MESFSIPTVALIIIALLSLIGTLTLIAIALVSVYMLVHNWNRNATNERLTSLEDGQNNLETELKEIKNNQSKFVIEIAEKVAEKSGELLNRIIKVVENMKEDIESLKQRGNPSLFNMGKPIKKDKKP